MEREMPCAYRSDCAESQPTETDCADSHQPGYRSRDSLRCGSESAKIQEQGLNAQLGISQDTGAATYCVNQKRYAAEGMAKAAQTTLCKCRNKIAPLQHLRGKLRHQASGTARPPCRPSSSEKAGVVPLLPRLSVLVQPNHPLICESHGGATTSPIYRTQSPKAPLSDRMRTEQEVRPLCHAIS